MLFPPRNIVIEFPPWLKKGEGAENIKKGTFDILKGTVLISKGTFKFESI